MEELLTARQLQDLLRVDRITVYRMLDRGLIPGFKVGGQWRFARAEIEAWLRRQREPRPQEEAVADVEAAPDVAGELPLHCFQAVQEIAADAAQVAAVIVGMDGQPLTEPNGLGDFSRLLLSSPQGRERYLALWKEIAQDSDPSPRLRIGPDGLWCAGAPVVVSGERMAAVVLGLFCLADDAKPADGHLAALAGACGVNGAELLETRTRVRCIDHVEAQRVQHLAARLAATLSQIVQERLELVNRLKRIAEITAMSS